MDWPSDECLNEVGLVAQPLTGGALTVLTVLTVLGEGGSDGVTSDEAGL